MTALPTSDNQAALVFSAMADQLARLPLLSAFAPPWLMRNNPQSPIDKPKRGSAWLARRTA